jgi:pimeloyl-ACP methyl ester carboxylesterase
MISPLSGTLDVPGARLHYQVRGDGPLVILVGAPMDAEAFAPLAERLADEHTVLTSDPRGINRSSVTESDADSTPELRADDLSRLITHLDAGPAVLFGSSGGAVTALALAQAHPDQVSGLIAHEPPLDELLDDREQLHFRTEDFCSTYLDGDVIGAWIKFFATANIPIPMEAVKHMFGEDRDPQVLRDERYWFAHELRPSTRWRPDLPVLRSLRSPIVVGIGEDSAGQLCDRTSRALADALDTEPTMFPGGHIAFAETPDQFADRLLAVLPTASSHRP